MFAARLNAAAANQSSPNYTPVISFNTQAPRIDQYRARNGDARSIRPRKLTRDEWFYVNEIDCAIGRVLQKDSFPGYYKFTLDNFMIFTVTDSTIIRGRYMKRSLSGKTFKLEHIWAA